MVLATDNEFHFEYLGKLAQALNVQSGPPGAKPTGADAKPATLVSTPQGQLLVMQIALHAADVNNVRASAAHWLCDIGRYAVLVFDGRPWHISRR